MSQLKVTLPSLGDDAGDEATVSVFMFDVGDDVSNGDDLVEMITDKATFIVPSPATGKIVSIAVEEDDVVKVGDLLAVMEAAD